MGQRPEQRKQRTEAEAAAWVARLGRDDRTDVDERAFRTWLADDPSHQIAFEAASETWQISGGLGRSGRRTKGSGSAFTSRRALIIGGGALAAGAAGATVFAGLRSEAVFETGPGEQRRVALADGSLIILDSSSKVHVRLASKRRDIVLFAGRAHFDVAKDPMRPFVVRAANHEVIAVGTAFDVSTSNSDLTVVLVEGRVAVEPVRRRARRQRTMMSPGQRFVFMSDGAVRSDRPDLAKLTAWQTGRLVFDNETLASAVAQMNRYSRRPLVIGDPQVGRLVISGIYSAGDVEAFATSVSLVLPVAVLSDSARLTFVAAEPLESTETR